GFLARTSPDGTPQIFNRPFLEYLGKTVEEIGQWRVNDIVHPDDLAHTIELSAKRSANGQALNFEFCLRRFDCGYHLFQNRVVPVRNAEGQILHWDALVTDIDDRKKAEEALQTSEHNLNLTINTIPTFISVCRADGFMLSVNQSALDYHGITLQDTQQED